MRVSDNAAVALFANTRDSYINKARLVRYEMAQAQYAILARLAGQAGRKAAWGLRERRMIVLPDN